MTAKNPPGFTLIELMITLAVAAVLLVLAVPSFRETIAENRLTVANNELVGALNLARLEAVKRGVPVAACASADGATCTIDIYWEVGWIVFTDATGTAGEADGTDQILRAWPAIDGDVQIEGLSPFVRYVANGTIDD